MQKKIILLLATLVVAFVFCGAASAATVDNNHINSSKITNVGTATVDQPLKPPRVTSTNPANKALNIPTTKLIKISFTRLIFQPNHSLIQLKSSSGRIIPITYSIQNNALFIDHSPLQKNTLYTLTLKSNCVKDRTGNGLISTYTTKFKTGTTNLLNYKAKLIIPKLGVSPNIYADSPNHYNAVYHYSNSAYFGTPGQCVLLGHRTTYSAILRYINLLNYGDTIIIKDYTAQKVSTYKVVSHEIVYNYNLISHFKKQGESDLILKSCYPVGYSYMKWVVHSVLVSTVSL